MTIDNFMVDVVPPPVSAAEWSQLKHVSAIENSRSAKFVRLCALRRHSRLLLKGGENSRSGENDDAQINHWRIR
ncbi:MAG TPA: hypothetical protein DEV93_05820 [Chloroflexi bacterium]|nr:hypothetical protein [Chloroflexota bacterium]